MLVMIVEQTQKSIWDAAVVALFSECFFHLFIRELKLCLASSFRTCCCNEECHFVVLTSTGNLPVITEYGWMCTGHPEKI